ncbi:titin-like, partial [Saccostrea cucullata]|uniref:titin-like n=1 Tax=Saccostrea cuccullata TaxID=36930 RepID=UPI002ED32ED7
MKNSTKFTPFEDSFSVGNDHSDDVSFSSLWLFDRPNPKPEIINITERKVIPSPHEVESTTITMSVDINVAFEFEVKWFRDEIPVTPFSGRFLIRQSLIEVMKCSLTILQLDLQDEGLWTVRVSNNNSEAAVNFHIKVKPGIQIEILPHDGVSIQKGDTLTLVCNITNLDDLQRFSINVSLLTWYKDGIKIQEGYSQKTFTNHRSSKILQIHSVQESDRGTYTCNHERYPISGVKNVVVDIYNQEIIRITQKEALPSLHEVKGTRLTMSVYVNVRINFGVQWFRNGIIATQSSGSYTNCQPYMEVMKCSLTILQLDFQDEAVWTARASNDNSEASTNFHVKVKPGINIEIQPNNDIFIQTGNTLYLDCRITNLDDLQRFSINVSLLTWYKDDVRIQEDNSRMTVTTQRSSRSLLIYPVQESDEGIYTCNHDKYRVSGVRNVKVGVYNQDIFIMKKEVDPSLHQPVGTTLTMSVYINVRLSVEMKWFKNGVLVTESSGRFLIRQSIELTKCSLTILGLLPEDEAIWTVRISNGNSEAAATFDIKVKPGIQIEILPHDGVSLQTGDTLTLVCNITNLDDLQRFSINVSLLTWYKHGVKLQEDKSQITFTTHQSSNILRIYPVQESDKGTYTCNHDKYQISGMENVIVDVYNNDIIYIRSKEVVPSPHEVEGTSLTMSVDINIRLNFEVKWFRDGIPVTPSSGRYLIRQSFREVMKCSITILQLDLQDEATWTVRVTNNNSEAATNFYIKVKPGIKIEILPHGGVSIQTGETLTLVCNITNLEDLQFSINVSLLTWYKDDIKLPEENYRVTTMTHRSSKILQIHSVQESDRGTYSCNHKRYPISGVKKVVVDIYRLIENLCPSSMDVYGIFWPTSFPGTLVHSECIESKQGKASRYCDYDGTWKETNVSNCEDEDLSNALKELQNLENEGIVDKEYIGKIFDNSLGVTENITATRSGISSENLLACINILNIILNIVTRSNASLPERDLYSIMDNILAIYNKESWKIIEDETQVGSDSIFKIMDRMNFLLMNESQPVTFTGENIVVHINNVSLKDTDLRFLENDSFFVLPKQGRDTFQVTYYAAVLYKTMSQLLPNRIHHVSGSKSDIVINSVILALTLEHPVLPLSPPLELTFQHMR